MYHRATNAHTMTMSALKRSFRSKLMLFLLVPTLVLVSSCQIVKMHRPVLQQGNLITQTMVDELKPGMTKEQVEFVLGRPVHLNTFNVDRWDYIYTMEDREGNHTRKHLSVVFKDDKLTEIGGDYKPQEHAESTENDEQNGAAVPEDVDYTSKSSSD